MGFWKAEEKRPVVSEHTKQAMIAERQWQDIQFKVIREAIDKIEQRVAEIENKAKVVCPTCGALHETKTWKEG